MYHITITGSKGDVYLDADSPTVIALSSVKDDPLRVNGLNGMSSKETPLQQLAMLDALDQVKERVLANGGPRLLLMYKLKREIFRSRVRIDLGTIRRALGRNGR